MGIWDTIKKPFKWWHEFSQRHKSFRGIWWYIEGGGFILLFLFLYALVLGLVSEFSPKYAEAMWRFTFVLGLLIFLLIVDPVGTLDRFSGGRGFEVFVAICVVGGLGLLFYRWRRGAWWKKSDEGNLHQMIENKLKELEKQLDSGAITAEEYENKRRNLLELGKAE